MSDLPFRHAFLGDVRGFTVDSKASGGRYDVIVSVPPDFDPNGGPYPLLVALDANYAAGTVIEAAQLAARTGEGAKLIVACVGTSGDPEAHGIHRLRDYLPTPLPAEGGSVVIRAIAERVLATGQTLEVGSGHAADFLAFLQDELIPRLAADFPIRSDDVGLLGHSASGAFTAHALLRRAEPFTRFVIGSFGASWWGEGLVDIEHAFAASADGRPRRVFHAMGGDELAGELFGPDLRSGYDLLQRLAAADPALRVTSCTYQDASHASAAAHVISGGLRALWPGGAWGSASAEKDP